MSKFLTMEVAPCSTSIHTSLYFIASCAARVVFPVNGVTTIAGTTYYNLQVGNATTQTAGQIYTLGSNVTVTNVLTVGPSSGSYTQTFADGGNTITLSGTGTPFVVQSNGAYAAPGTVNYTGNGATTITSLSSISSVSVLVVGGGGGGGGVIGGGEFGSGP